MSSMRRAVAQACVIFAIATAVMAFVFYFALNAGIWADYDSTGVRCNEYCENSNRCDHEMNERPVLQQPVNSWTNLAYFLAGLLAVTRRVDKGTITFLVANIYVFLGSFLFHASITTFWATADVAGMYTLQFALIGHGIHAIFGLEWRWIAITVLALSITVSFLKHDMDDVGLTSGVVVQSIVCLLTLFVIILVATNLYKLVKETPAGIPKKRRDAIVLLILEALAPGILFGLGVMCRTVDVNRTWCNPDSLFQGHGFWHCFSAAGSFFIWHFFHRYPLNKHSLNEDSEDNEKGEKGNNEDGGTIEDTLVVMTA